MTTFSQAIDTVIAEIQRPDLLQACQSWLNQTIREMHFTNTPGQVPMPAKYGANLIEDVLVANVDDGYVWTVPNMTRHQMLIAAYYPDQDKYAHISSPGTQFIDPNSVDAPYTVYRSGDSYVFGGYGQTGSQIFVAYYEYLPRLVYYPPTLNTRPCTWDEATETFAYNPTYGVNPTTKAQAEAMCTNWMLQRWPDLCLQGLRSKAYNRNGDEVKGKTAFSSYENSRPTLLNTESMEFIGFYRG